jgi:hypothetical protein
MTVGVENYGLRGQISAFSNDKFVGDMGLQGQARSHWLFGQTLLLGLEISFVYLKRQPSPSAAAVCSKVTRVLVYLYEPTAICNDDLAKKKSVTDFGCPRACRIRKYQFEYRSRELRLPTLFKT